jgi:AraC-like DNA-binding protein/mannose-6-phosphate isomerase-like protein (cupin superfamily)
VEERDEQEASTEPVDVDVREDGSERVRYDLPGRFSYVRRGRLSRFPQMRATCHWHDDLEFVLVLSGRMRYYVDGQWMTLAPGEGLFINSRRLHYGESADGGDCDFVCVLLHPLRMGMSPEAVSGFARPLMADRNLPHAVLSPGHEPEDAILAAVRELDLCRGTPTELLTRSARCVDLVAHLTVLSSRHHDRAWWSDTSWQEEGADVRALGEMVGFVHREHPRQVRLADIAAAGSVGRSTCAEIFRRHLHQSPVDFLIDVRLQTATRLLEQTDLPVATIAQRSGFTSAGYFSRTFHRRIGTAPLRYRRMQAITAHRHVPSEP